MQNYIDLVADLRPIILAARQIRDERNSLVRFLPNRNVPGVSYRLGRRRRVDQTVRIRAIDAPAVPIKRPGVLDVKGNLPAITPIVNLSEQDLTDEMILAQQLAGIAVDYQPWVEAGAGQVALTTDNTLELMRGQLLSTGKVALEAEDGVVHEVDFEIPDDRIILADEAWDFDDPAATFADYEAAHERHLDGSGSPAGVVLSTAAMRNKLVNAVQKLYPQSPVGSDQLNAYLANRDLPPVVTYDRVLVNEDGSKTRVFPERTMTFLPSNDGPVGETQLGVTQQAVHQLQRGTFRLPTEVPGMTVVTLGSDNPPSRSVMGATIGMPVLRDNEDITILKVPA